MIVYFVGSTNDPIISACVQNYECAPMTPSIKIAKFKFHQYVLRAVSPNLLLAKVSRYTVVNQNDFVELILLRLVALPLQLLLKEYMKFSKGVPNL